VGRLDILQPADERGGLIDNVEFQPVPEPATMLLIGTGIVGVAGATRRKKESGLILSFNDMRKAGSEMAQP